MKHKQIFSTIVDYFLIMSAIIGVGFASGKEICVFFFNFSGGGLIGILTFGLLYVYLFFVVDYIKFKLSINSYNDFNTAIFGRFTKVTNIVLIVNFSITCAGMLAGADYLFATFFNIKYKLPSITLSVVAFFIMLGGIGKIKAVANIIIPVMIAAIVINSIKNINPQNVNLSINLHSSFMAVYYGILFGVNNFVAALPVLFETKQKKGGRLFVIFSICVIILLNILVLACNKFSTDMPMFELSNNVSVWFYYIYFATLIFALFSTLIICGYNTYSIITNNNKSVFVALVIIIFNLTLSMCGYNFIVKYLYVVSSIFSAFYVLLLIVLIIIRLVKYHKN